MINYEKIRRRMWIKIQLWIHGAVSIPIPAKSADITSKSKDIRQDTGISPQRTAGSNTSKENFRPRNSHGRLKKTRYRGSMLMISQSSILIAQSGPTKPSLVALSAQAAALVAIWGGAPPAFFNSGPVYPRQLEGRPKKKGRKEAPVIIR